MVLLVFAAFVNHVKILVAIDGDIVSGLPGIFVRKLRPVVEHLVAMFAAADHELFLGFLGGDDAWGGEGGSGGDGRAEELAAGLGKRFHICRHVGWNGTNLAGDPGLGENLSSPGGNISSENLFRRSKAGAAV